MKRINRYRKKRRVSFCVLVIIFTVIIAGGVYASKVCSDIANTASTIYSDVETDSIRDSDVSVSDLESFSILLLGTDEDLDSSGRSDSIVVVTVNPSDNSTKIVSIPRDTLVEIEGYGTDKINHAYAYGGAELAINTVQNFLNIPIDYYVEIDMEGIEDLVDAVGGITVENELEFTYGGDTFEIGTLELSGSEALNYARMRKDDPEGDIGRQARQRDVIEGIVEAMADISTVTKYSNILSAVKNHMSTNVTLDEIISIAANYSSALDNIEELQLSGTDETINGIYYQIISDENVEEMSTLLREHLELE